MIYEEFHTKVLDELEKQGFDKLVNFYKPPLEAAARFINEITVIGYVFHGDVEECAKLIIAEFLKVTEELFPSPRA